jgi:hypothetical protein
MFWRKERRIDAESYLSTGFSIRRLIEERAVGWKRFGQLCKAWTPLRLKAILVSPEHGVPFFNTSQVFDIRPNTRKWLALERTTQAHKRFVQPGTILVMASANVGRSTLVTEAHANALISHHFMRVEVCEPKYRGWIYGYLKSSQARAVMAGSQYGGIIRHIEPSHLAEAPIPIVTDEIAASFEGYVEEILTLRNKAYALTLDAEALFENAIGPLEVKDWGEAGFTVKGSLLFGGRRRLEAASINPGISKILKHLAARAEAMDCLQKLGVDIWLPGRFKRIPAEDGIELIESSDVFETNPDYSKRIADGDFGDTFKGRVKPGWLLMARSGQIYGINGNVAFATEAHEGRVVSDDLLRLAIKDQGVIRAGYLFVTLSHPIFGRPVVKSLAYGSSIPHIDPGDLSLLDIPRLTPTQENAIADLAEESAALRAKADVLEREMAAEAGRLIDRFLAGDVVNFVVTMPAVESPTLPTVLPEPIPEHALVRLLKTRKADGVKAGSEGTVVHVYGGGAGYEVEFPRPKGAPILLTLNRGEIEEVL